MHRLGAPTVPKHGGHTVTPQPITENSQHEYSTTCDCKLCEMRRGFTAKHPGPAHEDPLGAARGIINGLICMIVIFACLAGAIWIWTGVVQARTNSVEPVAAPESLVHAREACPNNASLVKCRAALRHAYDAVAWQRSEQLKLAREMVGNVTAWACIHQGEGAWNAHTGNGYHGGLQMDATFERTYGRDMLQRYHGHAELWPPRAQIIVAQRAYSQGRGYAPWPNTSRACGLR
jgi:hypothetical protein